jgi:multiple sugar transport system substrate-binding protein
MFTKSRGWKSVTALVCIAAVAAGCSSGSSGKKPSAEAGGEAAPPKMTTEPVTLKVVNAQGGYNKNDFQKYFADPVTKKYPNITFEFYDQGSLPQLVTAGADIDIIMTGARAIGADLKKYAILADHRELAKKHGLDWNAYEESGMRSLRNYAGPNGELYGVPMWINYYVTIYNKSIFDKFAVPYPKDFMTWEDMFNLSKQVTKNEGGVQYKGLQPGQVSLMARGLSLPYVDPKTNKASVTSDQWVELFKLAKSIYTYAGNEPAANPLFQVTKAFQEQKNIAMLPAYGTSLATVAAVSDNLGFDWDVVTWPSYKGDPGKSAESDANVVGVTTISKHKDEAFKVIQYLTTDKDMQLMVAKRGGNFPSLKMDNLADVLGADIPVMKTKNLKGALKAQLRQAFPHEYDALVRSSIDNQFLAWLKTEDDAVTILRKIEEESNKKIEAEQKK